MSEELEKKLHPHEKKILLALKKMGKGLTIDIAKETGLPEATVHKAGQWARLKGLVEHDEKTETSAELTIEGKKYRDSGLPEKRLIIMVSEGTDKVTELKEELPELDIAFAWAKRKGWITVAAGRVKLTQLGRNAMKVINPVEKGLKGDIGDNNIDEMRTRKLARVKEVKKKQLSLTEKGESVLPHITDVEMIGQLKPVDIKTGAWKDKAFRPYDVFLPAPVVAPAKLHPYTRFVNDTRRKLIAMGFCDMTGPWVDLEFWNMDALYMPQDHPARGIHDAFFIKDPKKGTVKDKRVLERVKKTHKDGWITGSSGWGAWDVQKTLNLVLRSQTTAVSARTLAKGVDIPGMYFTLSRVFRPDVIDATHSFEFDQLEGIVIAENLTLRHLMGYLENFAKEIIGVEKTRFRPGYFPFTEPSLEMDVFVNGKWMELLGSGIFRPEVTLPLGCDKPVLAWGLGFARFAMIKMGITDIRDLFSHDVEWLRKRSAVL